MNKFKLVAPFSPDGDQPHAIKQLSAGLKKKFKNLFKPILIFDL